MKGELWSENLVLDQLMPDMNRGTRVCNRETNVSRIQEMFREVSWRQKQKNKKYKNNNRDIPRTPLTLSVPSSLNAPGSVDAGISLGYTRILKIPRQYPDLPNTQKS